MNSFSIFIISIITSNICCAQQYIYEKWSRNPKEILETHFDSTGKNVTFTVYWLKNDDNTEYLFDTRYGEFISYLDDNKVFSKSICQDYENCGIEYICTKECTCLLDLDWDLEFHAEKRSRIVQSTIYFNRLNQFGWRISESKFISQIYFGNSTEIGCIKTFDKEGKIVKISDHFGDRNYKRYFNFEYDECNRLISYGSTVFSVGVPIQMSTVIVQYLDGKINVQLYIYDLNQLGPRIDGITCDFDENSKVITEFHYSNDKLTSIKVSKY